MKTPKLHGISRVCAVKHTPRSPKQAVKQSESFTEDNRKLIQAFHIFIAEAQVTTLQDLMSSPSSSFSSNLEMIDLQQKAIKKFIEIIVPRLAISFGNETMQAWRDTNHSIIESDISPLIHDYRKAKKKKVESLSDDALSDISSPRPVGQRRNKMKF